MSKKEYLIGLDLIRICSVMFILAFHTNLMLGNTYGLFTPYIEQGAIFCSVFFLISGYGLFLSNKSKDLNALEEILTFYKKRLINIMPAYVITWLAYYFIFNSKRITTSEILILLPIDFVGLRCELLTLPNMSFFWFVSCIIICYIVYPFIQTLVKQLKIKPIIIIIISAWGFILYFEYLERRFGASPVYYSPFCRIMELLIGVCCCRMADIVNDVRGIKGKITSYASIIVACLAFVLLYKKCLTFGNRWIRYDVFVIPCLCIVLYFIRDVRCNKRVIEYIVKKISAITYEIYLVQTWVISVFREGGSLNLYYKKLGGHVQIVLVWVSCLLLAIALKKCQTILLHIISLIGRKR